MLEEYKNNIIEEIDYLIENAEIKLTFKETTDRLEKIKKLIALNDLHKEVEKIFYYYLKNSYDREEWRKAIEDNDILKIIYLTKYIQEQEEFFKRNINNLDNVLFIFKRVLEDIKDEEREVQQENEEEK